jgi:hypothetical protein
MSESQAAKLPKPPQAQRGATRRYSEKIKPATLSRILLRDQQLSQREQNAIPLLLRGLSDAQVAQQVGVDRGTVFRWRQDADFAAELEKQRQVVLQHSVARLQSMLEPALDILQRQITGDDPKTALRAAAILLRVATPARLQRLANPDTPGHGDSASHDPLIDELDAYINAPMPNEPGHPAYRPEEDGP